MQIATPSSRPSPGGPPDARHYGAVGPAPWGFTRTVLGTAVTLIPWVTYIVLAQLLQPRQGFSKPLSPTLDIIGGIAALVVTTVVEGFFLLAPAWFALARRRPGISARAGLYALGFRRAPATQVLGAIVIGLGSILAVSVLYGTAIQVFHLPLHTNSDVLSSQARNAPITTICLLVGAVFVAPFCEEVFFRGFVFGGFLRGMNVWLAGLLSALLFAIAHGDIGSFAVLFVIGAVLAAVRWRLGAIWPGMIIHALNNAAAAVLVLTVLLH